MTSIPVGAVEIPNEPVDLSQIHPSLHKYYGDGMPLKTYRTTDGATVRIWGACLPKTKEENHRNIQRAWQVADQICERAAVRYAMEAQKVGQRPTSVVSACIDNAKPTAGIAPDVGRNKKAADSSHPVSDQ